MNKYFLLSLLIPSLVFAQRTVDIGRENVSPVTDGMFYIVAGTPFSPYKYVNVVSGSPYFTDQWLKGRAILQNGAAAKSDRIKLDLLSGDIHYQDSAGSELIATSAISHLVLTDSSNGQEYNFSRINFSGGNKSQNGWYQIIETGTASLYKQFKKTITESKPFNSATTEQTIHTSSLYFIVIGTEISAVKKIKDIPLALADRQKELESFISSHQLSGKKDTDFKEVVDAYNTLAITK